MRPLANHRNKKGADFNMEIELLNHLKMMVIRVDGEIDHHIAKNLRSEIDRVLSCSGVINIAFDFSKVSFMDSSGIGVIMGRYKKVNSLGGRIIIFGMNSNIKRLIEMANLKSIAHIANTLEDVIWEVRN